MFDFVIKYRHYFWIPVVILISIITLKILNTDRWDGRRRFTLAVNADRMLIFSIEPKTKRAVLLAFPVNTLLDVPFGYGSYPASSVFRLGELDGKSGGKKLFIKSIENTFGVTVEGFFGMKSQGMFFLPDNEFNIQTIKQSYFSYMGVVVNFPKVITLIKSINTNLSIIEAIRLWYAVRSIRGDNIKFLSLEKKNICLENIQPDGSKLMVIDKDNLDNLIPDYFQDQLIRAEDVSIEIVNAGGKEKLAADFSRILISMGANVVSKNTAEQPVPGFCTIYAPSNLIRTSYLISRIKLLYQCKITSEITDDTSADIRIVLGTEFVK